MLLFPPAVGAVLLAVSLFFALLFSVIIFNSPSLMKHKKGPEMVHTSGMLSQLNENIEPIEPIKTFSDHFVGFMTNPWFLGITWAITLTAIALTAWAKILELWSGDWVSAKIQDGTSRFLDDSKHEEKRLLNIVEEISIAAGILAPEVLLLEREKSINAFITKTKHKRASLFVTAGCLQRLDREELQAVVAHELSHLVNGSLKNDTWMVGLLSGISIIYELGQDILGWYGYAPFALARGGLFFVVILCVGIILLAVGSTGVFCARLIKRATNRQRALLADAAAIQFTRSPALSRVLLKIALMRKKTDRKIQWFNPEPISHLCFADPHGRIHGAMLSAHPSLQKRAKALRGE